MKVHWLIPLRCDTVFQFTSRNELARSFCDLGNEMTTMVAYADKRTSMDGFSDVAYVHDPGGSLLKRLNFHWKMLQSTWKTDADVIIFENEVSHLIPFAWVMRKIRSDKKFIMDIRTIPVDVRSGFSGVIQGWRYNLSLWLSNMFCDGVTVITPILKNSILPKLKRLKNRIGIWTSGVNLSHFARNGKNFRQKLGLEDKKILIYHGILSPNRGLQNVVRTLAILRSEFPDLVLLLVGDGTGRCELEELIIDLELSDRVHFTGKVPYVDVPSYVRSADLAILPFPDIEWWAVSSPLKFMEYLAVGIPVIATDIEANRLVMNQVGGAILAKDDQPASLADSIRYALENHIKPADIEKLKQTISWKKQAQDLHRFLIDI